MLYEPQKDSEKGEGSIWRLVFGKIIYKSYLSTVSKRFLGGRCFYITEINVLCKRWEFKAASKYLRESIVNDKAF